MRRKKIFIQSDFSLAKTGFGRAMKSLLMYLYKTGKYDITHFCCGINYSNAILTKTPWKSLGCLPDSPEEMDAINRDPNLQRDAGYGGYLIDRVISKEKPDVYIGSQDIWAFPNYHEKFWWNKPESVIWTTLDSLPILPPAIEAAPKVKNYWIWSDFASKEMNKLGFNHVQCVHGPVEDSKFYKLPSHAKNGLRKKHGIPEDSFIIGFVFRNQLRKSVPNLLEGFSIFQKENPEKKAKLLLHTCYSEGWNINKLAKEYGVNTNDILTTYICKVCGNYSVTNFTSDEEKCPHCNAEKSFSTTGVGRGVTETQLNEVYNLMDVYAHPFTSGGQEIPIIEAKLAELITLVTNYSCGEELCKDGSGSLPLEWAEYREHGTEFRKASTYPSSIAKQLSKVAKMDKDKKAQLGKMSREWALENYSINKIGKFFEEFIDNAPFCDFDFEQKKDIKNPEAKIEDIQDNVIWVKNLYKNILNMNVNDNDSGLNHWITQLKNGANRKDIEDYFRSVAAKENEKIKSVKNFSDFIDENGRKRILVVLKESIGDIFLATSLLEDMKKSYSEYDLYFASDPQYAEILEGNPNIYKWIPYIPQMESEIAMTGNLFNKGFFDAYCNLGIFTQRQLNYLTNSRISLELK